MRFDRIRVSRFGGLHDIDTGEEALGPLVVVYGPNESGKSTFFHFLTSMLYGFRPATPTQHPYSPWSGDEIEGEASGRLDDGGAWAVVRRLRSAPWGRLSAGGHEIELRNRMLPFVEHVPRAVFQKVFALTLSELAQLDGETWTTLQERLLARITEDDLRSPRDVVTELRSEANALWRPDRRGQPRSRALTAEIRDLQSERRAAVERDREIRRLSEVLASDQAELDALRARRTSAQSSLERAERLLPARRLLARISRFESAADPSLTEGLPVDPPGTLARLREEVAALEGRVSDLERDVEAARSRVEEPGPVHRALLERRQAIESQAHRFERLQELRARRDSAGEEAEVLTRQVDRTGLDLFDVPWRDVDRGALLGLPLQDLAQAARRLQSLRADMAAYPPPHATSSGALRGDRLGLVSLVGGIGLVAVGAATGAGVATALGVALVLVGIVTMGLRLGLFRGPVTEGTGRGGRDRLQSAIATARARIDELLGDLPLRAEIRGNLGPDTVTRLEVFVAALRELLDRRSIAESRASLLRQVEDEVLEILSDAGIPPSRAGAAPERVLARSLAEAVERERVARDARADLERLEAELARHADALAESRDQLDLLEQRLRILGDGDPVRGAQSAVEQVLSAARLREAVQELRERFEGREAVEQALAGFERDLARPPDEELVARLRSELVALQEQEVRLSQRVSGHERDVLHLQQERTVSILDGEIEALKEERREVARERDRLALLGRIVEEAHRRFRDLHQPDVVRRTSAYLSRITDSRYRRVVAGEERDQAHLRLLTKEGRSVDVNGPLSTGTKEQVLLSLRLAVADHLDAAAERMPLFIDEGFVNWDDGRQRRGLELVSDLSGDRQVFVFTCHESLASVLDRAGGRVVLLDRVSD